MNIKKLSDEKRQQLVIGIMALIVFPAALILGITGSNNSAPKNGETVTVEGEYVCLPKEGDGPQTLECAFGLHEGDETYYALDFTQLRSESPNLSFNIGDELRVTGTYEQQESIYVSEGKIIVESFEKL